MTNRHVIRELADLGSVAATAAIYVGDLDDAAVGVYGSFTATGVVQESPDGTNWFDIGADFTDDVYRELDPNSQFVRVNCLGFTTGTIEANVGGQQRTSTLNRLEVTSQDLTATGAGTGIHVAHLEDSKLWTVLPAGSGVIVPQYSPDGSNWLDLAVATSVAASYDIPDHSLQTRILVSAIASGSTITGVVTGKRLRKGTFLSETTSGLSATGSTTARDCTKYRDCLFWALGTFAASIQLHCSPDGTNFYSVAALSDAQGATVLPSWAVQYKMVVNARTSGDITGHITENTGLRTDQG